MIINSNNLYVLASYFILAFFQFISVYYIVSFYSDKTKIRLIYGVSSPFIFILFGFPFKLLGLLDFFVIIQFFIFATIALLILKDRRIFLDLSKFRIINYVPILLLLLFLIHFLSFEARSHYTFAFPDMTSSHNWIKTIMNDSAATYQPGLAIYLSPIYYFLDPVGSLDYLGFAIGLVFLLYTAAILEILKKYLGLYFIIFFSLPLFIENQKYLVGFSNNQFFIIYIPLIFYLIYKLKDKSRDANLLLLLLSAILLSITITNPAISLYIGYFLLISLISLPLIFRFSLKRIVYINFIFFIGVILYILNLRMNPNQAVSFLGQYTEKQTTSELVTETPTIKITENLAINTPAFLYESLILLWEIIRIKFLENPLDSFFIAGGYAALTFSLAICSYSIIKKNLLYFLFSSAAVFFGVLTLTGIGQYSFIMGRVGWYFILLVIILASLVISSFVSRYRIEIPTLILGVPILIFNSLNPPIDYRYDSEKIHFQIIDLIKNSNQSFYLYSTLEDNRIYQENEQVELINNLDVHLENCQKQVCRTTIVAIDKSTKAPDPVLSRKIIKEKINDEQTLEAFYEARNKILKANIELERKLIQEGFIIYFNDENNSILTRY